MIQGTYIPRGGSFHQVVQQYNCLNIIFKWGGAFMNGMETLCYLSFQMKGKREFPPDVIGAGDVLSHLSELKIIIVNSCTMHDETIL